MRTAHDTLRSHYASEVYMMLRRPMMFAQSNESFFLSFLYMGQVVFYENANLNIPDTDFHGNFRTFSALLDGFAEREKNIKVHNGNRYWWSQVEYDVLVDVCTGMWMKYFPKTGVEEALTIPGLII